MRRILKIALVAGCVLAVELAREVVLLNAMGFEPGRFIQWVRSDDLVAR